MTRVLLFPAAVALALAMVAPNSRAENKRKAEGAELVFGGEGKGRGKFFRIEDLAFGKDGSVFVLDGIELDKKANTWRGNALVQKFDAEGQFLSEFSVRNSELGDSDRMARLTVDSVGRVYVSKPDSNLVEQYAADGKFLARAEVPGATGVTMVHRGKDERLAVLGGHWGVVNRKRTSLGGDVIALIDPATMEVEKRIPLSQTLVNVQTLAVDPAGNFFALADVSQLYKFDPAGQLLDVIGSGTKGRVYDGSQVQDGLAIDSKGNVVAGSWADATLFDAAFQTVTKRPGKLNFFNAWGNTRFAFDSRDRLWVAVTNHPDEKTDRTNKNFFDRPDVLRLAPDYFDPKQMSCTQRSALLLGLNIQITTNTPYSVAHEVKEFPLEMVVTAGTRRLKEVEVRYHLLNARGKEVDHGAFQVALQNGEEVRRAFTVKPPTFGWYAAVLDYVHAGTVLTSQAQFIGVSPQYQGMEAPADGASKGGWVDPARQMFTGLPFLRLHPGGPSKKPGEEPYTKAFDTFEKEMNATKAAGATWIAQLSNVENVDPEYVRALVTRFKGQVPIYEIYNEPNISLPGGLEKYIEVWKTIAPIIKEIDPRAKLMGPATVNLDLKWIDQFFAACAPLVDMVSFHDYEGHNTYDPTHWNYKIGELRKSMEAHGLKDKPLWQTERATSGVMRSNFSGLHQAVILTYHYDLLQSLGIPPEHNAHYYLNEGGYGSVPTYVWSKSGPHPAALALRTRWALTRGRTYEGAVDFGPNGNKFFVGLRYGGKDGDGGLVIVRNLGTLETALTLDITGKPTVHDAFDNIIATGDGAKLPVSIGELPLYIQLPAGASVSFPKWDWGRNFANEAKFAYSAEASNPAAPEVVSLLEAVAGVVAATPEDAVPNPNNLKVELLTKDPFKILVNGIMETHHNGDPNGGTGKSPQFRGDLSSFPQTLDLTFPTARPISKVAIFSERGDNAFCALYAYDLQAWQDGAWKTVAEVRMPIPASTVAEAFNTTTLTWQGDPNRYQHQFATPITTDKLRFVIKRTSFGFAPDEGIRGWSQLLKPQLMLKEIEVY